MYFSPCTQHLFLRKGPTQLGQSIADVVSSRADMIQTTKIIEDSKFYNEPKTNSAGIQDNRY